MAEMKWREMYGDFVRDVMRDMHSGAHGIRMAKLALIRLLTDEPEDGGPKPWQAFVIRATDGSIIADTTGNPHKTFREFVEAKPLRGLGESVADIERLLSDEPEALARLREELAGSHGGDREGAGRKSKDAIKNNNIILDSEPDLFSQPPQKPKKGDGPKKPQQGTSKAYTLSRLKKNAPELFERVKAGELSANAAALQAGFRKQPSPLEIVQKNLPKLTAGERFAIARDILRQADGCDHLGLAKEVLVNLDADEYKECLRWALGMSRAA
jgi:hypothetical protein